MTDILLYRWPAAARFDRIVPKTKFYERAAVSARVRAAFVAEVQRITWAYKLADSTIHLRGDTSVPEIQVFAIEAKDDDVSDKVLTAIDKAVRSPIIFEISSEAGGHARTRMTVAYKETGGLAPKLSAYLSSGWQAADSARSALPPALDLPGLYAALLAPMLPIAARPGEPIGEAVARVVQVRKLEREIRAIEKRLRTEPQLNRKVDLRRNRRDKVAALAALAEARKPSTDDARGEENQWTS